MKNIRNYSGIVMVFDELSPVSVAHGQAERILKACSDLDTSDQDYLVKLLEDAGALEKTGDPAGAGPDPAMDAAAFPDWERLAGMGFVDLSLQRKTTVRRQSAAERAEYEELFPDAKRFD